MSLRFFPQALKKRNGSIPEDETSDEYQQELLEYIRSNVIGDFSIFQTVFGNRPLVYADYVASGRSLQFLEDYITNIVLPFYANTHTFTSWVGFQTLNLRRESREMVKHCLNGNENDLLLFVGSGSTGAINKLVGILKTSNWGSRQSYYTETKSGTVSCSQCCSIFATEGKFIKHLNSHTQPSNPSNKKDDPPLVFISIFEHHSNILPWKEAGAEVIFISDNSQGELDIKELENQLELNRSRKVKIGSFSAGSNVNGTLTNVRAVTRLLKSYDAFSFFDYAAAAPYVVMDMNPSPQEAIDALFFSGHKFVGGPGTPGVLCLKRFLLGNETPVEPGGGTVFFVTKNSHTYLANPEEKEEGGTPDIVGSIRLGLVFQLKNAIGDKFIMDLELEHYKRISKILYEIPGLFILGNQRSKRLPIFSFLVRHGKRFFHYAFIAALLNDLFGIECRGGCACAGPYALKLLDIDEEKAKMYEEARKDGFELFLPGFVRLSFNYFVDEETIEYIIAALKFIAKNAVWFLPMYKFTMEKRVAIHRDLEKNNELKNSMASLNNITYSDAKCEYKPSVLKKTRRLNQYIIAANKILEKIKVHKYLHEGDPEKEFDLPEKIEKLRWFILPSEAKIYIQTKYINNNVNNEESNTLMVNPKTRLYRNLSTENPKQILGDKGYNHEDIRDKEYAISKKNYSSMNESYKNIPTNISSTLRDIKELKHLSNSNDYFPKNEIYAQKYLPLNDKAQINLYKNRLDRNLKEIRSKKQYLVSNDGYSLKKKYAAIKP
ncbi:hypothetical protein SteCoe_37236 [Stentor coeruleus]|uniref:C2H2-type domain-containing protein n=1 Tax=Stentor coeruleus TaxID=5963 RepID=A0A1R2ANE3_9CILI|nr:hypothetical protein SteCoe_37236 [Stentor coeruleus]